MPTSLPISQARQLFGWALQAKRESGRSVLCQLTEALLLRLPPCQLGLSEYYDYRLFDGRLRWRERRRFVGWRGESALDRANDAQWHCYADDKLLLTRRMREAGIEQPRLLCTYQAATDPGGDCARLSSPADLTDWLRTCTGFPLFLKPVHSGFGRGTALIEGYDPASDSLRLAPGRVQDVADFVASLVNPAGMGLLVQECLPGATELGALLSGRLSTLRMMTLDEGRGPAVYRAIWKLPRAHNIVDNFESGSLGNLLAAVELGNGRVSRVIQGYGLALRELTHHPDSGLPFAGLAVPGWDALCETTLRAARQLPGLRFQHWDVAVTARGAVPLEVNLFEAGGTELSQLVEHRGLLEPRLLAQCR